MAETVPSFLTYAIGKETAERVMMFPDLIVDLASAVLCLAMGPCFPILTGVATPKGTFQLELLAVSTLGYGGDLLVFRDDPDGALAIHMVLDVPGQFRRQRLEDPDADERRFITRGCINVDPTVYSLLRDCCYGSRLIVR